MGDLEVNTIKAILSLSTVPKFTALLSDSSL